MYKGCTQISHSRFSMSSPHQRVSEHVLSIVIFIKTLIASEHEQQKPFYKCHTKETCEHQLIFRRKATTCLNKTSQNVCP